MQGSISRLAADVNRNLCYLFAICADKKDTTIVYGLRDAPISYLSIQIVSPPSVTWAGPAQLYKALSRLVSPAFQASITS